MSSGSATIVGIIPCSNPRPASSSGRTRFYAFDADIFLGYNEERKPQTALALLHYFLPTRTQPANEDMTYYISGKLASITSELDTEEKDYDIFIEAFAMYPIEHYIPIQPTVMLAGVVGKKMGRIHFNLDIVHYAASALRPVCFEVEGQFGINRFDKLEIRPQSHVVLIGTITGEACFESDDVGKCVPFEFTEVSFISSDGAASKISPRKGKTTNFWEKLPSASLKSPFVQPTFPSNPLSPSTSSPSIVPDRTTGKKKANIRNQDEYVDDSWSLSAEEPPVKAYRRK